MRENKDNLTLINEWKGRKVKHFKNKEYLILDVAWHTECCEYVAIYKALYGECRVFVRPLDMFLSKVDKVKYPNTKQEYRMELIEETEE